MVYWPLSSFFLPWGIGGLLNAREVVSLWRERESREVEGRMLCGEEKQQSVHLIASDSDVEIVMC